MLLNLQQFAYDQIAGLKVYYNDRLESVKESFSSEIETLQEALAESCKNANAFQIQATTFITENAHKDDNSSQIIEELQSQLKEETERADTMSMKYKNTFNDYTKLKADNEDLQIKFEKLREKCDREIDLKKDLKERLDEIENKYQNISISTMHAKISSLKSQLDLQKLEDAKKIYEKDKKLKKAMDALKAFKEAALNNSKPKKEGEGEGDDNDEADQNDNEDFDLDNVEIPQTDGKGPIPQPKIDEESEEEDPEEIERNIKKMLQEEEQLKKEQEEVHKEEPPPEIQHEEQYLVDRDGFEQAIMGNPIFENLY